MTIQESLAAERAKYPHPLNSPELAVTILNDAAYAHREDGWGLLKKTSGTNWDGKALDILFNRLTGIHYDVLRDAEGDAEPVWREVGPMDLARWLAPVAPEEEPGPVPVPPSVDLTLIKAELAELQARMALHEARIVMLEAQPVPQPQPPVTVETSPAMWHKHKVTVPR